MTVCAEFYETTVLRLVWGSREPLKIILKCTKLRRGENRLLFLAVVNANLLNFQGKWRITSFKRGHQARVPNMSCHISHS